MQYKIININDISEDEYKYYYSLMSCDKKARVDKFRFIDDKKRTIAGEMLARQMIAKYYNICVEDIVFYSNEYGKPYAKDLDVEFNISHSEELVICAISDNPIGVDIEKIRDVDESVISRVCSVGELDYVNDNTIGQKEKQKSFFEIWTFKEAYFKWLGTGIAGFKTINYFDKNINQFNLIKSVDNYIISLYNISEQGAIR